MLVSGVQLVGGGHDELALELLHLLIERLWRTVKYEEVFLKDYGHLFAARESLDEYFRFYNERRRHTSLGKRTPAEVYWNGRTRTAKAG